MMTMKIKFLIAALLAAVAFSSLAQDVYLGGNAGFLFWDDERFSGSSKGEAITGGVQAGYEFSEMYAVELSSHSSLNGPDADLYSLSGYRFYGDRSDWSKYLVGGLSYGDPHKFTYANDNSTSLHLGVGLAKYLNDRLEFRGDIRAYGSFDDSQNFGGDPGTLVDLGINLALNYHFNQPSAPAPRPVSTAPAVRVAPEPAPQPEPEPVFTTQVVELSVLFNTNEDTVISYGEEVLEIGEAMAENPELDLTLEGHTDSRGAAEYNRDLSQRRANTVKNYLVESFGISPARITSIGYGEERPIASNDSAEGRAQNRRVTGELRWREEVE